MTRAALVLLIAFVAACGGGDDRDRVAEGCERADAPERPDVNPPPKPREPLDRSQTHRLVVETSCGEFTIELDPEESPNATASLVSLADAGYFDGTIFHRVVPGFVIQGGDPTGTGRGGPGYSTVDRPARGTKYELGVVAMAKTGTEPAGTAGSQFFVVTADDAGLPPDYAVVGRVVDGMDAVRRIEALGDAETQTPRQRIVVEKVTVETSA